MGVLSECDEVAAKIFRGRVCSREEVVWAYVKHLNYHISRTYCTTAIGLEGKNGVESKYCWRRSRILDTTELSLGS